MTKLKALLSKYREMIMYLVIGVCTTAVNWLVYTALTMRTEFGITSANAVSWLAAVIFAFFTNKLLVFESKSFNIKIFARELISFFGARIISGIIETFAPEMLVNIGLDMTILGIKGAAAKLSVSVIVIILNYAFSKLVVFRKSKEGEEK